MNVKPLVLLLLLLAGACLASSSPCDDSLYQELRSIPLDSLSARQFEYFTTRDKLCAEYQLGIEGNKPKDSLEIQLKQSTIHRNRAVRVSVITVSSIAAAEEKSSTKKIGELLGADAMLRPAVALV